MLVCIPVYAQETTANDTAQIIICKNFEIPQLKRHRTIRIFLPAGYNTSNKKYPVIYMQDGQRTFGSAKNSDGSWQVDDFLKQLPVKKQCIIVAIDNSEQYRMSEYNPFDGYYAKQTGIAYTQFMVETLKPYIDSHYRTKSKARYTAIAGSSMGGIISMYAALKYPQVFGSAGIFSAVFWVSPKMYTLADSVVNKRSRFYFVCGDQEGTGVDNLYKMDSIVRSKGLNPKQTPITIIKKGKHNEQQWANDFPGFYNWLIAKF
jgi:predicted alpha/beta superfamily hydrolase